MEKTQRSKLLSEIPPINVVVTMGCNVTCLYLPCKYREDWGWTIRQEKVTKNLLRSFGGLKAISVP